MAHTCNRAKIDQGTSVKVPLGRLRRPRFRRSRSGQSRFADLNPPRWTCRYVGPALRPLLSAARLRRTGRDAGAGLRGAPYAHGTAMDRVHAAGIAGGNEERQDGMDREVERRDF
jgi:hypothetical protein